MITALHTLQTPTRFAHTLQHTLHTARTHATADLVDTHFRFALLHVTSAHTHTHNMLVYALHFFRSALFHATVLLASPLQVTSFSAYVRHTTLQTDWSQLRPTTLKSPTAVQTHSYNALDKFQNSSLLQITLTLPTRSSHITTHFS